MNIISMRIRMQGFLVFDFAPQFAAARKELSTWLAEGKIKRKETIIKGGLAAAEKGLVQLYEGVNTGMFDSSSLFLLEKEFSLFVYF